MMNDAIEVFLFRRRFLFIASSSSIKRFLSRYSRIVNDCLDFFDKNSFLLPAYAANRKLNEPREMSMKNVFVLR